MTKHAKLRRNIIRAGLLAALVFNIQVVQAGYAQLSPPVGWSSGGGLASGAGGTFNFGNAANSAQLINGTVRTNAALSVGGRAVSVPASMRFAANASRIAAVAIYANPALRTAVTVAGWLLTAKIVWDSASGSWRESKDTSSLQWYANGLGPFAQPEAACKAGFPPTSSRYVFHSIRQVSSSTANCVWADTALDNRTYENGYTTSENTGPGECPTGWTQTAAGCLSPALDQPTFTDKVSAQPMPSALPSDVPYPLPVDLPEIQPLFIPTGNPVNNPSYDPSKPLSPGNQPWNQPGVRVVPAPLPGSPWQVDLQPVDRPVASPNPDPNPKPDTEGNPDDKPNDKDPGLCDMYPEILACAKPDLDTPDGEIPKAQRSVELSDSDLFGGGSCPANVYSTVGHKYLQVWNWDQSCYFIVKYLKPVILVLGAFTALMIVSGGTKE